ncbi:HAD-IIIC family phosphatase [Azospirillum soli]|uniref:HAD-IIIC family phosphatase n=1 Tax=Azospirillum soli TaxID=1304799 RepID=UPI001AE5D336|nr:HAD-IIIC family phosphatase [Azospirillum soli]MBP2316257.1 FkbH-like protein [Azospirillum soli]
MTMSDAATSDDLQADTLARLRTADLGLAELIQLVNRLDRQFGGGAKAVGDVFSIGVSANASVDLLAPMLKKHVYLHGLVPRVVMGDYATPVADVRRFLDAGVEHLLALFLFDNLMPSLEARVPTLEPDALEEVRQRFLDELCLVLDAARPMRRVFLPTLHRLGPPGIAHVNRSLDRVLARFNDGLSEIAARFANVTLLSPGAIVEEFGWKNAFDPRFYYRSKAPYKAAFLDRLAEQVLLCSRGGGSYYRKVLVLDCDNTLWGGIVGEDGIDGIKLDPHDYPGNVFWAMQHAFLALGRSGVLLCLCSKNNPADVDAVLSHHPNQVLRDEHIIRKAVNWSSKVDNLRDLAEALNLGLDSFVFLDDSAVECEEVAARLPMVKTIQVPAETYQYPMVAAQLKNLFIAGGVGDESADKTAQYRLLAKSEVERQRFASHDDYLASLGIAVTVSRNDPATALRAADLSQKSNQFNVTTRRYTHGEIAALMEAGDSDVYVFRVTDRHGDYGLTGVAVIRYTDAVADVESFFMSCRVIGRGIEFALWPVVIDEAKARGCLDLTAVYRPTAKNVQVQDFFDRLGMTPEAAGDGTERRYRHRLGPMAGAKADHIAVHVIETQPAA